MSTDKAHYPFSVTIYMAEGQPDGIRIVKQANWDGIGIICPRSRYSEAAKRPEFARSGVYILVGSEVDAVHPRIYVGETETLGARLPQHSDKDFWTQVVMFTKQSEEDPLNKAEARYLEARLLQIAKHNKRCDVENQTEPGIPSLSEEDKATMDGYLRKMLPLLSVIGVRVFEGVPARESKRVMYYYKGGGWNASGYETNNGFVVLKGSIARAHTAPSTMSFTMRELKQLTEDKTLVENESGLLFTRDHEFNSPSGAGSVVSGRNVNGLDVWKDKEGKKLKDNQTLA